MPKRSDFPNAKWMQVPQALDGGGYLVGALPNGDQIQNHEGVYVRISMSADTWNAKEFYQTMQEVAGARRRNQTDREYRDLTARIVGDQND